MKKSDKRPPRKQTASPQRRDGKRKFKLKPTNKQKYKPKQVYADELDDDFSDIDLFGLKEDEDYDS